MKSTQEATVTAGLPVMLGIGAMSSAGAGKFRNVPAWANNGHDPNQAEVDRGHQREASGAGA